MGWQQAGPRARVYGRLGMAAASCRRLLSLPNVRMWPANCTRRLQVLAGTSGGWITQRMVLWRVPVVSWTSFLGLCRERRLGHRPARHDSGLSRRRGEG